MKANLLTTSGRGVQNYIRVTGRFEIHCCNNVLSFTLLQEAYQYFLVIEEEVSL